MRYPPIVLGICICDTWSSVGGAIQGGSGGSHHSESGVSCHPMMLLTQKHVSQLVGDKKELILESNRSDSWSKNTDRLRSAKIPCPNVVTV